ncbi:MAG: hypothetical protein AAGB11_01930 [Pseudomonadota bacterium]
MILISYGITKSGSTLAYQLAKNILAAAGHRQDTIPRNLLDAVDPDVNFITSVNAERLHGLMAAVPSDTIVAVKTHAPYPVKQLPELDQLVADGKLKVHASCRDPREICLALLDAGRKHRAIGERSFADITTLDEAAAAVDAQIHAYLLWASVEGTLKLGYDRTAFEMPAQAKTMAEHLGVSVDTDAVCEFVAHHAKTHKNKALPRRFKTDLTPAENAKLYKKFETFIIKACHSPRPHWYARHRERFLKLAANANVAKPAAGPAITPGRTGTT